MRYAVQVQSADGTAVLQSERMTLDATTAGFWLSTQLLEATAGVKMVLLALNDADPLPEGWPTPVDISGAGYTLPVATAAVLGGLKVGTGLTVSLAGLVSVDPAYIASLIPAGTGTGPGGTGGGDTPGDTILEDSNAAFVPQGAYITIDDPAAHGGTAISDNMTGNSIHLTFTGTRMRIFGAPRGGGANCVLQASPFTNLSYSGAAATSGYSPVLFFDSGVVPHGTYTYNMYSTDLSKPFILDYASITP